MICEFEVFVNRGVTIGNGAVMDNDSIFTKDLSSYANMTNVSVKTLIRCFT